MHETGRQGPPRAARLAVAAIFFVNGAGFANWVVRIPAVRERLGLGEAALGTALLGVAVGAMLAMPIGGGLVVRYGSRPVVHLTALPFCASLVLPPLAPSLPLLALSLVVLGACSGVLDVAMNAQAAVVERRYGRPIMASFHGLFSLGGLAGAAVGGLVAARGVDPAKHLLFVALALGALAALASSRLLAASVDASGDAPMFALPPRSLLATGAVAFCVLFGEGSMADWSAVYLRNTLGTDPGVAAAGFAAFSLMMAAGRLTGDALLARFGVVPLVRLGGLVASLGLALALALGRPWAAVVGFGGVGAGLSIIFPCALSAAGRNPDAPPGTAIAAVSTLGYAGFLAGPPLIGLVAGASSLRAGLALVLLAGAAIALLAPALGRGRGRAPGAPARASEAPSLPT